MRKYSLYKLTFPNDKVYIGQTVDFVVRMRGHKNDSFNPNRRSRNCQVNNAIRKYGWDNVKREIILTCKKSQIDIFERKYIKLFKAMNRDYGYNRESGGNRKKEVSVETRKLISKARSGKRAWGKPILQIDLITNKIVKKWDCIKEVERVLGAQASNISTMCNGNSKVCYLKGKRYTSKPKSVGGFKWSFLNQVLTIA